LSRRLTFSDPDIIAALAPFVPVAVDCDYTERRPERDRLRAFWEALVDQRSRKMFANGVPGAPQGFYVFSHDGVLHAAAGYNYVLLHKEKILALIAEGLDAWKHHTPKGPPPGADAPRQAQMYPRPADTVVLCLYQRIDPVPVGSNPVNNCLGRDHAWIPRAEVDELVQGRVPEAFWRRLAFAHLRDNVRGFPFEFAAGDLKSISLTATPRRDADRVVVALAGAMTMSAAARAEDAKGPARPAIGYECKIEGQLVVSDSGAISRFTIVAEGEAWGYNIGAPDPPPGRFPLVIGLRLATPEDRLAWVVPPFGAAGSLSMYLDYGIPSRRKNQIGSDEEPARPRQ